ncbi:hypothetical protein O9G_005393 [Rozella allomycis CSF55]|uniref:Uncharacterized protein n=1 Tax=Rozella allomycis (strain CSF55) TaxID=988480 RepID=A0A075AS31_ROZAC|nr:hypothetical protein O9G_005393 [Rozella allomycis CSF55]|eukprot:EPZ33043.1 hypothetical protein O9G_005393 [Rozella allomycis CSF55]
MQSIKRALPHSYRMAIFGEDEHFEEISETYPEEVENNPLNTPSLKNDTEDYFDVSKLSHVDEVPWTRVLKELSTITFKNMVKGIFQGLGFYVVAKFFRTYIFGFTNQIK